MKLQTLVVSAAVAAALSTSAVFAEKVTGKAVGITKGVMEIAGISRNQDGANTIHPAFAKTSRPCPPFCIQPTNPFAPNKVRTISELDVIAAAEAIANGDTSKVLMDSRTPVWTTAKKGGTIKHSINIPFSKLNDKALAKDPMAVVDILTEKFGVKDMDGVLDYSNAKDLYFFCNGLWCGQSPAAIKAMLKLGYPASKMNYYRGGMNSWHAQGLSTVGK